MAEFKVVISDPKSGKSMQKDYKDASAEFFMGKKVGDTITGESIDISGYEFMITGGSDKSGFPMRKDVPGATRAKILAVSGIGLKKTRKGMRSRKTVFGNTIDHTVVQINMKITKYGKEKLFSEEPAAEGAAAGAEKKKDKKKKDKA
jgi:small subunit ribosomal protein S6e